MKKLLNLGLQADLNFEETKQTQVPEKNVVKVNTKLDGYTDVSPKLLLDITMAIIDFEKNGKKLPKFPFDDPALIMNIISRNEDWGDEVCERIFRESDQLYSISDSQTFKEYKSKNH